MLPELKFGQKFCVYFNLEPYVGVIVTSRIKGTTTSGDYVSPEVTTEFDESGEMDIFDVSVTGAVGIEIPISQMFMILA